jgi:hypothetical protein
MSWDLIDEIREQTYSPQSRIFSHGGTVITKRVFLLKSFATHI